MKVWIYCVCYENNLCYELGEKRKKMIEFARDRRMNVLGITSVNGNQTSDIQNVVKVINKLRIDAILVYDTAELSCEDRQYLLDSCYKSKISIIPCKYAQ